MMAVSVAHVPLTREYLVWREFQSAEDYGALFLSVVLGMLCPLEIAGVWLDQRSGVVFDSTSYNVAAINTLAWRHLAVALAR